MFQTKESHKTISTHSGEEDIGGGNFRNAQDVCNTPQMTNSLTHAKPLHLLRK